MRSGEIKCIAVDTPVPSVFSHEILNSNPYAYLDDAPLEERRARAVEMRRTLPESVLQEVGALDPAAIAEVRGGTWPDVRDADELADTLHTLIALPENFVAPDEPLTLPKTGRRSLNRCEQSNRATRARISEASIAGEGACAPISSWTAAAPGCKEHSGSLRKKLRHSAQFIQKLNLKTNSQWSKPKLPQKKTHSKPWLLAG